MFFCCSLFFHIFYLIFVFNVAKRTIIIDLLLFNYYDKQTNLKLSSSIVSVQYGLSLWQMAASDTVYDDSDSFSVTVYNETESTTQCTHAHIANFLTWIILYIKCTNHHHICASSSHLKSILVDVLNWSVPTILGLIFV